jgi:hypothetical protein
MENLLNVARMPDVNIASRDRCNYNKRITAEVIFGSPNLGCRGTGICKIMDATRVETGISRTACNRAPVFLAADETGKSVSLLLIREFVCLNIYKTHLRKGILEMASSCTLPTCLVEYLSLDSDTLAPGCYPIQESDGFIHIRINLQ